MAITTSNVLQTAVQSFFEGMVQPSDSWTKIYNVDKTDAAALRLAALTGIPDPGTWDGSADLPTASLDSTGAVTMAYQAYGVQVRIPSLTARDLPSAVSQASNKLGRSVASKMASLAWAHLETAFTAGGSAIADGKALCANDHTTATGTRSNLAADSALDRSAVEAMITQCRTWTNFQDQVYDWAQVPKFLVVPPALETAALQAVGSPFALTTVTTSGAPSQGEINTLSTGRYAITVVCASWLTDANDYFLIADPSFESPLTFWSRAMPSFNASTDSDSQAIKLNVTWASATASGPQPDGIIGCDKS